MHKIFLFCFLNLSFQLFSQFSQIDVQSYKIDLTVTDKHDTIVVKEKIVFDYNDFSKSVSFNLISVDNSGKGMRVQKVMQGKNELEFSHKKNVLTLNNFKVNTNKNIEIEIHFKGVPIDGLVIGKNKFGSRTFFGDNWPNRAQNWFACNDHPSDKSTVEYIVNAPAHYEVVANGQLISKKINKKSVVYNYQSKVVLPTKVMVVGIANLSEKQSGTVAGILVFSAVYPENEKGAFYDFDLAPSILQFFVDYIAPYEYEKLTNVQSTTRFGGMENAGCIFYDENSINGTRSSENLIAHEIVHQWFGNSATEKDWPHLWLSEGFATYLTNIYIQKTKGEKAFQSQMEKDRSKVVAFSKRNNHSVVDTNYTDLMDLLNANSYQKGGWVLHMLRSEIGDSLFQQSIRTYYQKYRLSNADSKDFQNVVESVTNRDLDWFFKQWLYEAGHPILRISKKLEQNNVSLSIIQQGKVFRFPLTIEIKFKNGQIQKEKIQILDQETNFNKSFNSEIEMIRIDPNVELLFQE
ncbi:MAG: M1 family metallopeptidase [Flavobacteriales bacterium]|nr:M1 family metallopeptidase [Flavobacteriales bacterium]